MSVEFVNAEVLRVGSDETLVIRLPENGLEVAADLAEEIGRVGLAERALIICSDGVEFAVAKREEPVG
jgi:hypothetical protein